MIFVIILFIWVRDARQCKEIVIGKDIWPPSMPGRSVPVHKQGYFNQPRSEQYPVLTRYLANPAPFNYEDRIKSLGIELGRIIEGTVIDVAQNVAYIDVYGLNARIDKNECGWNYISNCDEVLAVGNKHKFLVKAINLQKGIIQLSLKCPETDPWQNAILPNINDVLKIEIQKKIGNNYVGIHQGIDVKISEREVSWVDDLVAEMDMIGNEFNVVVLGISEAERCFCGSIRGTEENPWPKISIKYPKGTQVHVKVRSVSASHVKVELPDGVFGFIPREAMLEGGFEYENYEQNVVPGQGIEAVVSKVFLEKRKMHLNLKRSVGN